MDRKKTRVPDKADDREQSEAFIEAARLCDAEGAEPFEKLFKRVVPVRQKKGRTLK